MGLLVLAPATAWGQGAAAPAPPAAPAAITWEERFYNPAPLADDVILHLPCGGALALRRVDTEASGDWLRDQRIRLGIAADDASFGEYVWSGYIAGGLTEDDRPETRHYLIGKYEVTRDQYAAVMGGPCRPASAAGRVPATGVSWFDAVGFTQRLTEWLNANAPGDLPVNGDRRAFVRLPGEAEWEFAARGGNAVTGTDFRGALFPMPEGLDGHAWHQGSLSCAGDLQPIGLLAPNPLGLHDVIGNAEEVVFDLYRMNRAGRLHGQVGGMTVRGGSCQTDAGRLRTAMRTEYPLFDDAGQANRLPWMSFRVAVGMPVAVSLDRVQALRQDWADAAAPRVEAIEDPAATLAALAAEETDVAARERLVQLSELVRREIAIRNEVEARALQSAIVSAAVLIRKYRSDSDQVRRHEQALALLVEPLATVTEAALHERLSSQRDDLAAALESWRTVQALTGTVYLDLLFQTAEDYPEPTRLDAVAAVKARYEAMGITSLSRFADLFEAQVSSYVATAGPDPVRMLEDLREFEP